MSIHKPVMLEEVISLLSQFGNKFTLIDCNLGEGGHTKEILSRFPNSFVYGLDRDREILESAKSNLSCFDGRFSLIEGWNNEVLKNWNRENKVDFILFDLGISMFHYKTSKRGFSFLSDEKLDMRLDSKTISAYDIVNGYQRGELERVLTEYGEENYASRIVDGIINERKKGSIETTFQLKKIVECAYPKSKINLRGIHPATKTFQALRIETNLELEREKEALENALELLNPDGILAVITFHSLEDRIAKDIFAKNALSGNFKLLSKKPILPSFREVEANKPSRSAKLRAIRKI